MPGVSFSHPAVAGSLNLRLPPTSVDWGYNLVTSKTPTYAGEVVQILSVNFDKLTISGRIGQEGPWGMVREKEGLKRRRSDDWNTDAPLGVGLIQMTAWFRAYFSIASQGRGKEGQNYREEPVTLTYQGGQDIDVDEARSEATWKVYPVSFPSYRRALDNFAPEWKVECEVYEAPGIIQDAERMAAVDRLAYSPLYTPLNPFSDPRGMLYANKSVQDKRKMLKANADIAASQDTIDIVDYYNTFIEQIGTAEISELIFQQASLPATVASERAKAAISAGSDRVKESRSRRRLTDDALRTFDEK